MIATGQFIGEGTDIGVLDCLILAYPFPFEGKLFQYIGRVQRSLIAPVINDFRDYKIEYFNSLFKQRNKYYRRLMKSGQLTNLEEIALVFRGAGFYINTNGTLQSIDCLDLPLPVEEFKDGIVWKLRINNYDEKEGELVTEIIDYGFPLSKVTDTRQGSFYFMELKE